MTSTFKSLRHIRSILLGALLLASAAFSAMAQTAAPVARVGLGQASAAEPPLLGNLKLSDPLVRQKYLNEPDMLRFLRATYSEACSRGLMNGVLTNMSLDPKKEYTLEQRVAAKTLVSTRRVWKLTSLEMEALGGAGYLNAANYCDCMMREVADADLVNPKKGLEVLEATPENVKEACRSNAKDQTEKQMKAISKK